MHKHILWSCRRTTVQSAYASDLFILPFRLLLVSIVLMCAPLVLCNWLRLFIYHVAMVYVIMYYSCAALVVLVVDFLSFALVGLKPIMNIFCSICYKVPC